MRIKLIISAAALAIIGFSEPAVADYIYPGGVIIDYTPPKPPPIKGNAMAGPPPGCVINGPIACECEPKMSVLEACHFHGVDTGCLTPEMPYKFVQQPEPVVSDWQEVGVLGTLMCTGQSNQTAHVILPPPEG